MEFKVGDRVKLQNTGTDFNGSEGIITELREGPFGIRGYEVDFGMDVSKYTISGLPTRTMVISEKYLSKISEDDHVSVDDYDTLIDLALATNDKEWFIKLTEEKKHAENGLIF